MVIVAIQSADDMQARTPGQGVIEIQVAMAEQLTIILSRIACNI
jgi:hypothetical protein